MPHVAWLTQRLPQSTAPRAAHFFLPSGYTCFSAAWNALGREHTQTNKYMSKSVKINDKVAQ
jgi:hypothetical protein